MNFVHSGSLGDIIYSLPTVLGLMKKYNSSLSNFYLKVNIEADYAKGYKHPAGKFRMDIPMAKSLMPLLQSQSYFNNIELYTNQQIDCDLDLMRILEINYGSGYIPRWYFWTFDADYDLSQPWLEVEPIPTNYIVVNRTSRYNNPKINYRFLNQYKVLFVGLKSEYEQFKTVVYQAEYAFCSDLLSVAKYIAGSKLYIGNQSVCFAIAEALKVKRLLEVCTDCPNVIPMGEGANDAVGQIAFEEKVNYLFTER